MTLNGSLAGLVAITAGCDTVSPFGVSSAAVAGILVVLSVEFFDNIAKIDDPGAVSVHFATASGGYHCRGPLLRRRQRCRAGLFYGGGLASWASSCCSSWSMPMFWPSCRHLQSSRPSASAFPLRWRSTVWTSMSTDAASAYAGFAISDANSAAMVPNENTDLGEDALPKLLQSRWTPLCACGAGEPVVIQPRRHLRHRMHKVSIIAAFKFDQLKSALNDRASPA